MTPKVDSKLYLSDDGKTVTVTGPIGGWAIDEAAAMFSVVISQPSGNGARPTTAIGSSIAMYEPDAGYWTAEARVTGDRMRFRQGGATATAWATIAKPGGGAEAYKWKVQTTLKKR